MHEHTTQAGWLSVPSLMRTNESERVAGIARNVRACTNISTRSMLILLRVCCAVRQRLFSPAICSSSSFSPHTAAPSHSSIFALPPLLSLSSQSSLRHAEDEEDAQVRHGQESHRTERYTHVSHSIHTFECDHITLHAIHMRSRNAIYRTIIRGRISAAQLVEPIIRRFLSSVDECADPRSSCQSIRAIYSAFAPSLHSALDSGAWNQCSISLFAVRDLCFSFQHHDQADDRKEKEDIRWRSRAQYVRPATRTMDAWRSIQYAAMGIITMLTIADFLMHRFFAASLLISLSLS